MDIKHDVIVRGAETAADYVLKYLRKDPEENLIKVVDTMEKVTGNLFPKGNFEKFRNGVRDPENVYRKLFLNLFDEVDHNIIKRMIMALGVEAGYFGTKTVRANREKYDCNIPWLILMDPTSACNMKCKGCWAAEYDRKNDLTLDEMRDVIAQMKALGTHFFMFTGGEPLIRKADIITLCEENKDCGFLAYTNATLVDEKFCDDMRRVGNLTLALSIEGTEESNDARRGAHSYERTIKAMNLLKENKCLFGISICYTSKNVEFVTSDDFLDKMASLGCRYAFYFNYMPVGHDADKELIPTPSHRKYMYMWLKRVRNGKTGKPLFIFDFQDDGEYVGGCIAGGRNYFHINSNGDIEPCVFVHYSDANIRTDKIIDALKKPLFTAYYKGQPFNDNHLRPCPLLENPDKLRQIVKSTGARSTNFVCEEDVDTLCGRCDEFAYEWKGVADELWSSMPHKDTHTQYYRDKHPEEN